MECKAVLATLVGECGLNLPRRPKTKQNRHLQLNTSTIFEFQTSDVSRALALRVLLVERVGHGMRRVCDVI